MSSTFTTRMDSDLKQRLEKIAAHENRSASYVANQAIQAHVEEREETYRLIDAGLELIERGAGMISEQDVTDWLKAGGETSFPAPDSKRS